MNFVRFSGICSYTLARYTDQINSAGGHNNVPPCLLAAIAYRESKGCNTFQIGVPRGPGCGVGLCQITYAVDWTDLDKPVFNGADGTVYNLIDPTQNFECAAKEFLVPLINHYTSFKAVHPREFRLFAMDQIAYAVCGAYNAGQGSIDAAILAGTSVDAETTNNYASWTFQQYLTYCVTAAKC